MRVKYFKTAYNLKKTLETDVKNTWYTKVCMHYRNGRIINCRFKQVNHIKGKPIIEVYAKGKRGRYVMYEKLVNVRYYTFKNPIWKLGKLELFLNY